MTNTVIPGATPSEMATDVEANQTVGEPSAPSTPRAFSRSRDRNEPGAISVPNASKNSNVHVAVPSPIHFLTRRPKNNGGPSRIPVQERGTSPVPPVLPKINNQVAATVSSTSVVPIARESGSAASIAPAAPITRRAGSPIPIVPALPRTGRMSPRATSPTGSASSSAGPANPSAGSSKRPSGPGNNPGSANRPTGSIDRSGSANRPTGSVNLQTGPANILTEPDSSPNEAANPPTRPRNDGKKSNTGSRRRGGNRNRGRIAPAAIAAK